MCDATCVDLDSDVAHCGSCGSVCGALDTCNAGRCECAHTLCSGTCVSLDDDPLNCGSCGHDCAGGACIDGMCQPIELVADPYPSSMLLHQDRLYWISGLEIRRADLDDTNVVTLATELNFNSLVSPPLAAAASWLFFANSAAIWRVPLDGSAAPSVSLNELTNGTNVGDVAADETHLWTTLDGDAEARCLERRTPLCRSELAYPDEYRHLDDENRHLCRVNASFHDVM